MRDRRLFAIFGIAWSSLAFAGDAVDIGAKAPAFRLPDYRGAEFSLEDFSNKKIVVLAFLGTECPLVKLYGPRLARLAKEYESKGVAFVGVAPNAQDSLEDVGKFVRSEGLPFPILKDPNGSLANGVGATRTPEVVVLDAGRSIRYRGRIDDQYGVGVRRPNPTRRDLAEALDELIADQPVSVAKTKPVGCVIGKVRASASESKVTYSNQIARLLQKRCVECHRAGEIAPFALTSYDEVVGWAETVREVIDNGRMPPWFADPKYGKFFDDGHLTPEEKELMREWVAAGCPEGDPKVLPPPREFVKGWGMPEPDLVVKMSDQPVSIPADGVMEYQYYTIDPGWTEDKWICGAEARPGNPAVVHHILVFLKKPGKFYIRQLPGDLVSAYAPGMRPTIAQDEDMALRAPAGSKIVIQMHYTPNGKPQTDLSYVGFKFRDSAKVKKEIQAGMAINTRFQIPPNDANYAVNAGYRFKKDAWILGVNPHMHLRGKSFRYEALYPDGRKEILMDCPRYDFNWQLGYKYVEPIKVPAGTRLACTATFDNSADNPNNPNPNQTVRFGEQTFDEMMIGWFFAAEERD